METCTAWAQTNRQCVTQFHKSHTSSSFKANQRVPRRVITLITNKKTHTQPIHNELINIEPSLGYTESQEMMSSRTYVQSIPLQEKLGNIINRIDAVNSYRQSSVFIHDSFSDLHYSRCKEGITISKMQKQRLMLESSEVGYKKKAGFTKKLSQRAKLLMKTQQIHKNTGDKFYRYTEEIKKINLLSEYQQMQHTQIQIKPRATIKLLPLQKKNKPRITLKSIQLRKHRRQTIATHRQITLFRSRRISTMVYQTPGRKPKQQRQSTTIEKNTSLRRSGLRVFSSSVGKDRKSPSKLEVLESHPSCGCLHLGHKKSANYGLMKEPTDEEETGCWS